LLAFLLAYNLFYGIEKHGRLTYRAVQGATLSMPRRIQAVNLPLLDVKAYKGV